MPPRKHSELLGNPTVAYQTSSLMLSDLSSVYGSILTGSGNLSPIHELPYTMDLDSTYPTATNHTPSSLPGPLHDECKLSMHKFVY